VVDERALRQDLEALQHHAKVLREERAAGQSADFVRQREALEAAVRAEEGLCAEREAKASPAVRRQRELATRVEVLRDELTRAEQRRLSPWLMVLPFLGVALVSSWALDGDSPLRERGGARVVSALATAVLGVLVGRWARRSTSPELAPSGPGLFAGLWQALQNPVLWSVGPLLVGATAVLARTVAHDTTRLAGFTDFAVTQAVLVLALGLAVKGFATLERRAGAWVASLLGALLAVATVVQGINFLYPRVDTVLVAALVVPLVAANAWAVASWRRRGLSHAWWALPAVLSLVASGSMLVRDRTAWAQPEDGLQRMWPGLSTPMLLFTDEVELERARARQAWRQWPEAPVAVAALEARLQGDLLSLVYGLLLGALAALGPWFLAPSPTRWRWRVAGLIPLAFYALVLTLR